MGIRTQIKNEFLIVLLVLGSMVFINAATCPSRIFPDFCSKLQAVNDEDWVYCKIHMSGYSDWVYGYCDKVADSTCLSRPPDTTQHPLPESIIVNTRVLFETYDLRWPDNKATRAAMPTVGGQFDSVSHEYHIPSFRYVVYATKHTILTLGTESYVNVVENWEVTRPLPLLQSKASVSIKPSTQIFNLKGQSIEEIKEPEVKVKGMTIFH